MEIIAKFLAYVLVILGTFGLAAMLLAYVGLVKPGVGVVGLLAFGLSAFFSWFFFSDKTYPHL